MPDLPPIAGPEPKPDAARGDAPAGPLAHAGVAQAGPKRRAPRTIALVIATAFFMEQLDGTVLATALPSMAKSFGVDPLHMSIALTSYLVSLAVFIPASGKVADRLGSRTVFMGAIGLFMAGSLLCAQSGSLGFLVAARLIQGAGGAMMVPVGRLVLLQTTAKHELISAMSWLLIPATMGPLLGPVVGGLIVTALSWQWIFYINLPIGAVGLLLAWRVVPQLRGTDSRTLDLPGMVLSGIALACLIFGLELASRGAGSLGFTATLGVVGVASGLLYARHARRTPRPVLDVSLMRIRTFGLSVLAGSASRIAVGAIPFLLPMTLQLGLGMTAARSGLTTFVVSVGSLMMRGIARRLLHRFGYRGTMIVNGVGSAAFAFACATFRHGTTVAVMDAVLFLGGFSQALQFIAYNTIAYADVPAPRMSAATSFYATLQQVTLTLGICVAAASLAASVAVAGRVHPTMTDFSIAFATVGLVAAISPLLCARLPRDAGAELSGHAG